MTPRLDPDAPVFSETCCDGGELRRKNPTSWCRCPGIGRESHGVQISDLSPCHTKLCVKCADRMERFDRLSFDPPEMGRPLNRPPGWCA